MTALPEALIRYLADRDAQRANDVAATLAAMTERERRLVREAAVMGYVRGRMHPANADHPKDSAVLHEVIACCLTTSDLYPVISGIRPCRECTHPGYNHRDADDPAMPDVCLECQAANSNEAPHSYRMASGEEQQ
ncbi:MAG: hypothetical protein HOV68_31710 [Streptomycetaceae bacterium]|nr:hypothetical protein [Streptomycetaceae bacterium]